MKLRIVQSLIPHYREPFFARLADDPRIDLEVWADLGGRGSFKVAPDSGSYRRVDAPYREIGPLVWQPSLMRAVDGEADVVVTAWNPRYVHLLPAIHRAHRRGVGVVLWGHGVSKAESGWRRAVREKIGRAADALVLYTPGVAAELASSLEGSGRVFVAPNSIDRAPIDSAKEAWPETRLADFLAARDCLRGRVVVFVSRLDSDKRVGLLIESFRRASQRHPDLRLVLIGDGSMRDELERQARDSGIGSRVRFEGALYDEDCIAPWMQAALCMAYPGPIGLSLLHAFAYGVPVITVGERSSHGPEIEALVEHANGLRVRAGDPSALADAISSLAADPELRDRLARNAATTFSGQNGWNLDSMVEGFTDAVEAARRR